MRYLFQSFDSRTAPTMFHPERLGKPIKRDMDLRERQEGDIEIYIAKTYNPNS